MWPPIWSIFGAPFLRHWGHKGKNTYAKNIARILMFFIARLFLNSCPPLPCNLMVWKHTVQSMGILPVAKALIATHCYAVPRDNWTQPLIMFSFGRVFLAPLLPRYDEAFGEELNDALTDLNEQLASGMSSMFQSLWSAITASTESQTAIEIQDDSKILQQELLSMPHMLAKSGSGATGGFEEQIQLMWLLIINHDIGLLRRKLLGGSKCLPVQYPLPLSEECKDFHKHCLALEALDLIVLHSEVTLAMAKLEPSWALALYEKTMLGLDEAIYIIGEAQWVCMNAVDNIQDPHNQHQYARDTYNNMQPKLDFLLFSSGRYDTLFSYPQTGDYRNGSYQNILLQSMTVPPGADLGAFGRSFRYYVEESQVPGHWRNFPIHTINGTYRESEDRVPEPDPTRSAKIFSKLCHRPDPTDNYPESCKCYDSMYNPDMPDSYSLGPNSRFLGPLNPFCHQ